MKLYTFLLFFLETFFDFFKISIPIGDVNHDGELNYNDYDKVFEHLGSKDINYDLNRDKIVDIADLQYVNDNMGRHSTKELKAEDASFILD